MVGPGRLLVAAERRERLLVGRLDGATGHLGVAAGHACRRRCGVQRAPRVALQVVRLARVRHRAEEQLAVAEPDLGAADPRRAVGPQGREHVVPLGLEPRPHRAGEVRCLLRELVVRRHGCLPERRVSGSDSLGSCRYDQHRRPPHRPRPGHRRPAQARRRRPRRRRRPAVRHRRGADARLDGRRGAAPHPHHRPLHLLVAQPPGVLGQGRHVRARSSGSSRSRSTATATRCWCKVDQVGARLPHRRPHLLRRRRPARRRRRADEPRRRPRRPARSSRRSTRPLVPVTRRLLADGETPVGVYRKLAGDRPGTFLLESAEHGPRRGRATPSSACAAPPTLTERDGAGDVARRPACRRPSTATRCEALREADGAAARRPRDDGPAAASPAAWSATSATTSSAAWSGCRDRTPRRPAACPS